MALRYYHNPPIQLNLLTHKQKPNTHLPPPSFSHSFAQVSSEATSFSASPSSIKPIHLLGFDALDRLAEIENLDSVKAMHARMIKMRSKPDADFVAETLVASYLELGDYRSAAKIFLVDFARNYAVWNRFLEGLMSYGGDPSEVLEVYKELHCKGVLFDSRVITMVLKICTSVMDTWLGLEIHGSLIKRGFELDIHLKCALMNFYERCWGVEVANRVVHEMSDRDDMLWNEAIMMNLKHKRYVKARELFREMHSSLIEASQITIVKMLQTCGKEGALNEGMQIHGYVLRHWLDSKLSICNSLISMYSRNDRLELARSVFDSMQDHNLTSWNSIITSYASHGYLNAALNLLNTMEMSGVKQDIVTWNCLLQGHALHGSHKEMLTLFRKMQFAGFRPNALSITSLLQAIIELGFLSFGKEIHGFVIREGLDYDVYVGTSLLDMYVKNDCLTSAQALFDNMKTKNIFAWNSLISGYSYKGLLDNARGLIDRMQEEGIKPDLVTWNGLVAGFSKWGYEKEASAVIHDMKSSGLTPNVISWTALISGCSQNGKFQESFKFFIQMLQEGVKPNGQSISSLLKTCGGLSLLGKGKEVHCLILRNGFIEDAYVKTALIDMYSKSGDLKSAYRVFRETDNKNLASWNCMIMGFAIHGPGTEAISLFNEMQQAGILPDAITFTALLSACKNSGLVREGWKYFDSMSKDHGIKPRIEHYSCMVDLLGRAGYLDEAWDFIQTMPVKPDASCWGAFLGSCRIHRHMEFSEIAAKKLFELEPDNSANYVLMMNLYAMSNRWDDVELIKDQMIVRGVRNGQVWSWIQVDHKVHAFSAGGEPHPDEGEVYFELYQLVSEMKKVGYVPDINCVYQNIDEAEKEKVLLSHTEKLAITYGLIKTGSGAPIRVIKNSRMCSDCHTAAKFISLVRNREIVLRDGVRFHNFKAGKCSCHDYW